MKNIFYIYLPSGQNQASWQSFTLYIPLALNKFPITTSKLALVREHKKSNGGGIISWILVAGEEVTGCMNVRTLKTIFLWSNVVIQRRGEKKKKTKNKNIKARSREQSKQQHTPEQEHIL